MDKGSEVVLREVGATCGALPGGDLVVYAMLAAISGTLSGTKLRAWSHLVAF